MAAPAVAGAGALVRQYFEEGWYPSGAPRAEDAVDPSGALVKATLLNSTVDMTGITGYPSDLEGWGRVLLENALYFDGDLRRLAVLADLRNADGLSTGGSATHVLAVEGSDEMLKVTLVFTDPAAALLAAFARVNDLDLEVTSPSGSTYRGNVIDPDSGLSFTGGSWDLLNNVEMVTLDSPEPGDWTISIVGSAVNEGTQGYALVASGQVSPFAGGVLRYDGHIIDDSPPLGNGDGVVDPGETITMPATLLNSGGVVVTGVSGSLASNRADLVRILTPTAVFPDIPPEQTGTSMAPDFRYTVSPAASCGDGVLFEIATQSNEDAGATFFPVDIGRMRRVQPAPGLPVTIPKQTAGLVSTVDVADPFDIDDVHVAVSIEHEDVGELVVELTSPQGTTVVLHDRSRAGFADLSAIYDLELPPDGPGSMSDFDLEPAQGTWSLTVRDLESGPVPPGQLLSWSLDLRAVSAIDGTPLSCSEPVPAEVGPTLTVGGENGSDLTFDWQAVPGATGYRIWSSEAPGFDEDSLVGSGTGTTFLLANGLADPTPVRYYVVRAVNSCEWEGP
jgi:subtilisin-like proprotein convertase family protein